MIGIRFGFLVEQASLTWSAGQIEPLPEQESTVQSVLADERHYDGWFYPPLTPVRRDSCESKEAPSTPATFALPPTHLLTTASSTVDASTEDFFIALFGMLKGLRLQREGWQHFYRCPTKRGSLCDFYADNRQLTQALDLATNFWRRHTDASIRKLAFGTIHWHLFAQLYQHEFERFNAQYTAFDACWALAKKTQSVANVSHAERPQALAQALGLLTPDWAFPASTNAKACALSMRRNDLVHEALYADQPIGFAHPQTEPRMELELTGFVARCILALLGVRNEYTCSPVNTRQCIGFS